MCLWQVHDDEDIVSNLRNGVAAENATAIMQEKGFSHPGAAIDQSINVTGTCNEAVNLDQEEREIDESNSGEPWVGALTEGDYSDLRVDERLNALVSLIGVAIEGNSIRVVLEDHLEAANALKKKMWAEAQLDKKHMKEEYMTKLQNSSYMGIKAEPNATSSAAEGSQSPLPGVENKNSEASPNPAVKSETFLDPQNVQNYPNCVPSERTMVGQEFSLGDNLPHQQYGYAIEKSRSQLKASIGHKAEGEYVYRSLPLGQDRRHNRYWLFFTSDSRNDPGSGRIFFESHDGCWRLIDSEEAYDALLVSLDKFFFWDFLCGVSIPSEALQPFWTDTYRKSWGVKFLRLTSSSAEELLQILTLLESAIKRNFLSSNFESTKELLASSTSAEYAVDDFLPVHGSVAVLPLLPETTAAVALRVMDIDSSISYITNKAEYQKDTEAGEVIVSFCFSILNLKIGKKVRLARLVHELTQYGDSVGNAEPNDREIDQTPNKATITGRIRKDITCIS
ncbi:homeobox-DDT domain protein RLT2-like [Telopea speciosissima]|uniref:homeobox-DDT domain protein RLT2-like n=1 Tax=Telopea speciosissima TaxID=54955 RepID=UPI001CC509CB|nr:homeobox-DDT domain protein RLT2-like [Telopea speciosissima]